MRKTSLYLFLIFSLFCLAPVEAQKVIQISGQSTGKTFDGIGIVDGGGATSVLLKDYPEQQRGEILDMLYKPKFGGSISTLLVEIPGDGNSTQGSMPSHSHYRGDNNFQRGYTWWVLQEAKKRNPQLSLDATGWSAPAWVSHFWSQDMADYYVSWLQGLRSVYGIEMDAIGCHNEKGASYDFAKALRRTMNERGFKDVKLHGFDNWGDHKMDFLKDMQNDVELRDAFYAVSAHTFSEIQLTPEQRKMAEDMDKPIWNSEDHNYLPGFDALITIVKCFNENYIISGATKVINWYGIAGVYPLEPYSCDPAMVLAREPWSGHYSVREALWGYAHYGQFTEVGWKYVDDGCGNLPKGGTVATLRNPKTGDYSMIFETKGATERQTVKVKVGKGLSKSKLCVWRSTADEQFVQQPDLKGGSFTITLEPGAVYSVSTTTGQQHGAYADIPASKPFPIPYADDFEQYKKPAEWGYLPHYLADLIGAFELVERPDHKGQCIRQTVGEHTLSWAPEWHHYTILGDSAWTDYEVSADVYLNPQDEAAVMGRLCNVGSGYGIWAKGYYLKLDDLGNCKLVITRGKLDQKELIGDKEQQEAILARKDVEIGGEYVLAEANLMKNEELRMKNAEGVASGTRERSGNGAGASYALQWHNLKLRFDGDLITGYVDGKEVVKATSDHYRKGMAGLMAPLNERSVSTPYFDNLRITPLGRTQATNTIIPDIQPLYRRSMPQAGHKAHDGQPPQTLSELKSEYVTIDDSIRVHYKIWNEPAGSDAKTICFVHGFGCDMNTWEKQFEAFRDEKNLKMVFIDLPGYGKSDKPYGEYTFDFFAHAIDEVLNANGIKDAVFVGHSLGTPVCRYMLMTTDHGGALVDVDGVYCFYNGTETPEYIEAVNQFGHAFDGPDCREVITGFVSSLAGKDTPQWVTGYAMSVMPETPQYVASSTMQHLVERQWWPNRQLTVPVMVICTQNSGLEPDNEQKMQALYPTLDYTELTSCGHFIHMEQAEMFNAKLKAFIGTSHTSADHGH